MIESSRRGSGALGGALYLSAVIIDGGSAVICWFDGDVDYLACGGDRGLGMRGDGGRGYDLV